MSTYLLTDTMYLPAAYGITTSCILSSSVWLGSVRGRPSISVVYPSFFSVSTEVPIQAGRKCVSGQLVASNLTVPSLKTVRLKCCRARPFSSGSEIRSWFINSLTPFRGSWALRPIFSCASTSLALRGNGWWEWEEVCLLHLGQCLESSMALHAGH